MIKKKEVIWFISHSTIGEWNYAEDAEVCVRPSNWLRPVVACLPAWFRFAQVLESFKNIKRIIFKLVIEIITLLNIEI